ncbi:MAG: UvrB/UvrC motif-containing protein [Lentisphaeria bacterium]|nr:UvrB/UvrC motif-containing protein [Lentisphaeria bacterium]
MLCDICKKNNAVIRIQKINNGKNVVVNLCADCAEKHKAHEHFEFGDIEIGDILDNIKKITKNLNLQNVFVTAEEVEEISKFPDDGKKLVKCPKCGFTLVDVDKNSGKLGCSECYKVFEKEVMEAIENIHRCKIHVGKHPIALRVDSPALLKEKIAKLEQDLQQAVRSEKYEQAAILRDELNLLKKSRIENE